MGQLVTAQAIIDKVRFAGDQQGATLRTTDADLLIVLKDSWARYIGQASGNGWPYWLNHVTGTLDVGRAVDGSTDYPFGLVDIDFVTDRVEGVYRFEIRLPNGEWVQLDPVQFSAANDGQIWRGTGNGQPECFWTHGGSGEGGGYPGNTGQTIGYYPPADTAYTYRIWYAAIPAVSGSAVELDIGVPGADWWIVWDIVETVAIRDHYPELAQMAAMKRQQCWAELMQRMAGRNKGQAFRVRDTKGQRYLRASRRSWIY